MTSENEPVLLVDFENIQDLDYLKKLRNTDYEVRVFVGPHQTKLPTSLVRQTQPFGNRLQWIQMEGHGKNALDFHIAYTIGLLSAVDGRKRRIFVLSKDAGFDPLISYLNKRNILCKRVEELGKFLTNEEAGHSMASSSPEPPLPLPDSAHQEDDTPTPSPCRVRSPTLNEVLLHLNSLQPRTRPKKPGTLAAHLASHFKKSGTGTDFPHIVKELVVIGKISVNGDALTYHLK
ncbi:MAG: hypothetical protein KA603_15240 [Azonexus sp.]|nr:hypothetical protein [Betaproteobacteria bacterium]MBK8919179.1 hypothetical protein [Betaproteobacteria bacterium]MBP6037477.1 hypothetical protein [Azonexus sp.]MBP6908052.1 hypothetical protein [Azonexus sp.]